MKFKLRVEKNNEGGIIIKHDYNRYGATFSTPDHNGEKLEEMFNKLKPGDYVELNIEVE